MSTALPNGFGITLDPGTKQLRHDLWFGGTPPRVLRLTAAGVAAWNHLQGGTVDSPATGMLARQLTDAGLAHPVPPPPPERCDVTVVVPVLDRVAELDRCLAALGTAHPVLVVDDGSRDAAAIAEVAARHGAGVVRRDTNGGPGAARNTALAQVRTELVAFVDSDCVPPPGWVERLAAHLADPLVAAAAPRITADAADTWSGRFTRAHGSLDLGPLPARVAPLTRVSYVPTAALVVRRSAMLQFEEHLRVGEDVDLIWRLHDAGHRVRYDPAVQVPHREPAGWPALLRRRARYGTSAAPLARRHPAAFAPLVLHAWPTACVTALLARRPVLAATAAAGGALSLHRTLRRAAVPTTGLLPAVGNSIVQTGLGVGRYLTQLAAPALLAGLGPRRTRLAATALLLAPPLTAWRRERPGLDPVRYVAGAVADDVAYGAGVWAGCLRTRSLAPVVPRLVVRPVRVERAARTTTARVPTTTRS